MKNIEAVANTSRITYNEDTVSQNLESYQETEYRVSTSRQLGSFATNQLFNDCAINQRVAKKAAELGLPVDSTWDDIRKFRSLCAIHKNIAIAQIKFAALKNAQINQY